MTYSLTVRLLPRIADLLPFLACLRVVHVVQCSLSYLNAIMSLERAESTISVDRPVFPLDADGRVFERWHEAVGFTTRVRRVPRSECRGRPYDADGHMLMPVSPRIGEVPALLARLMRESPPDRLSELAVRRLSATLDDAIDSLASRIARSERPRPLKRAMGRYRRLSEALALRADPDTAWRERELS